MNLFDLNPSDDWRANPKNEKAVTLHPGCCSSLQEPVAIPNPFQVSENRKTLITKIHSIQIEECNDGFCLNIQANISAPNFFVAKTAELNSVCYVLIDRLINELGQEAYMLEKSYSEEEDPPNHYQDDRRVLKKYLDSCGLDGHLAFENDFLEEWAMATRFQIETIGLVSKPLMDSAGEEVVLSIDGEENLFFNFHEIGDFGSQLNQANNPSTSQDVLRELSTHPWQVVRAQLTFNEAVSSEIIEKLSYDMSGEVRAWASDNDLLSDKSRLRLSNDDDEDVRSSGVYFLPLERQIELAGNSSWKVRAEVAQVENLPNNIYEQLLADKRKEVIERCICNPSCPQESKLKHINSQHKLIRLNFASGCAEIDYDDASILHALEILAYDDDYDIKRNFFSLIQYGSITPSQTFKEQVLKSDDPLTEFLAMRAFGQVISDERLGEMAANKNNFLRREIASYENTPYNIRVRLSQDDDQDVRCCMLALDNLQEDIREKLESDQALMEYSEDWYIE